MLDNQTGALRPEELGAVYAISRAVAQTEDIDRALDEIIHLTRKVLIFDTMVIYIQQEQDTFEPRYARVIGRGRSAEADLAWGESTARQAHQQGQTALNKEALEGWKQDRLALRQFLGLPLRTAEKVMGALVLARYGGPDYLPDQIRLAEFIAAHIAQLMARQRLVEHIASLEAERKLIELQSDFIATVTHELCTPLGFIKGYATSLLREDTTWDEATRKEFLVIIDEEADRLRELVDSLLDSSRLQAGTMLMEFQPVRLDTLLREVTERAQSRHENLTLQLELNSHPIVQADSTRLAQVFDNLLSNAVKYAPGSNVAITLESHDNQAHILVKDSGPGIAAEHLSRLFERFFRVPGTPTSTRGTGLGLYICRQLIQAHRGEITAESQVGLGTTFHIYLPIQQAKSESKTTLKEEKQT